MASHPDSPPADAPDTAEELPPEYEPVADEAETDEVPDSPGTDGGTGGTGGTNHRTDRDITS